MRVNPFVQFRTLSASSPTDIEAWTEAAREAFAPFMRRRRALKDHRMIFRTELINLLPILENPNLVKALQESVRMCRRVIYSDPAASHAYQVTHFPETSLADGRWLSLAASTKLLAEDSSLEDRAAQLMMLVDAIAEGCIKPRIAYLFGFAFRLRHGRFPQRTYTLGECIAEWPAAQTRHLKALMSDPMFELPISQWRNISAHHSYRRVGMDLFEVTYGRNMTNTIHFSFSQLEAILEWTLTLNAVCRMANVIVDIEFMSELKKIGLPDMSIRMDAFLITLSHNLRMVGFSYLSEETADRRFSVYCRDDLGVNTLERIIHASQVLDNLALVASQDFALKDSVEEVGIGLVSHEGETYAMAVVKVNTALQWLDRRLSLEQYAAQVNFMFTPGVENERQ